MKNKTCFRCKNEFPETKEFFFFGKNKNGKEYPTSYCKKCSYELKKEYNIKTEWYKKNYQKRKTKLLPKAREAMSAYYKKYITTGKGVYKKLISHHDLKNRGSNGKVIMTESEFIEWFDKQPRYCAYCGIYEEEIVKIPNNKFSKRLTIDRKDNNKDYTTDNIVLACHKCNTVKNSLFTFEEMKDIGESYIKPKWTYMGLRCEY